MSAQVHVIRFPNGTYHGPESWRRAESLDKAKFYAKKGPANQAISYHKLDRDGAVVVSFELTEVPA